MTDHSEMDSPRPRLFGPPDVVHGYYELEVIEKRVTLQALRDHQEEVGNWYRLLTCYCKAMEGEFHYPEDQPRTQDLLRAFGLRLQLLGLGIGTAKSALDRLLAGYYSQALGDIRHLAETFLHIHLLSVRPDSSSRWFVQRDQPQKQPIAPADALKLIVDRCGQDLPGLTGRATNAFNTWKLAHKGAHPTPEGITQTIADADAGRYVFGATYDQHLTLLCFDHGLTALWHLTETAAGFSPRQDQLLPEVARIQDRIGDWRCRLPGFPPEHRSRKVGG